MAKIFCPLCGKELKTKSQGETAGVYYGKVWCRNHETPIPITIEDRQGIDQEGYIVIVFG